jgi:predicted metal-dependent HD superfamily phosphohydrolase
VSAVHARPTDAVFARSRARLDGALGAGFAGDALYHDLLRRYAEPGRHYHTLQHLAECLAAFEANAALAQHPAQVEAALWFHDAVYDPRGGANEEASAQLALAALARAGAPAEFAGQVAHLVRVTEHRGVPATPDEMLLVDIDLAILGADEARFDEYERQVRLEYAFVPDDVFYPKRAEILRGFLARPRLYGSARFHERLEDAARRNLARSIAGAR